MVGESAPWKQAQRWLPTGLMLCRQELVTCHIGHTTYRVTQVTGSLPEHYKLLGPSPFPATDPDGGRLGGGGTPCV